MMVHPMEDMHGSVSCEASDQCMAQQLRLMWRGAAPNDCRWLDITRMLRDAGLRLTRQRIVLGRLLFAKGDRHITAAMLHDEAVKARIPMTLATVYNTLNNFTEAGLLRRIGINGTIAFFDTNPSRHHHFFVEDEHRLFDIPSVDVAIGALPTTPAGFEISGVDVVVRLKRRPSSTRRHAQ